MKTKLAALLSSNRSRMIVTVIITAVIVTMIIGIGSTLAANDQPVKTAAISEKAAKEIALNKTDGGILESFKMDYDDGKRVYEVDIVKGNYEYDIKINAETGEIIGFDQDKIKVASTTTPKAVTPGNESSSSGQSGSGSGSNSDSNTSNSGNSGSTNSGSSGSNSSGNSSSDSGSSYIGKAKAKSIALARVGGGKVVSCYLDYDDGRAEYDVKIYYGKYEYEMEINAKTGRITDYDRDIQDRYERDDDDDDHYDDDHDDDHYDD